MKYADLIVPRGRQRSSENDIAIDFIVQNLEHKLVERGFVLRAMPVEIPFDRLVRQESCDEESKRYLTLGMGAHLNHPSNVEALSEMMATYRGASTILRNVLKTYFCTELLGMFKSYSKD